jgi:hypothetical protein
MTTTMDTLATATTQDANAILQQTLDSYGLGSMAQWAWNQITTGASPDQVLVNLYQTPQFAQRFPGIIARQKAGLPPISPASYISYEDSAKQLENQYGLPRGFLSNPNTIGEAIGNDVSMSELTSRVQQGYAQVAYAPPEVRQAYAQMFGASGDGALASQFLDFNRSSQLLTEQATAAQISGDASMGGTNMSTGDAMKLAQMGHTQADVGTTLASLQKESPLFNASIHEQNNLTQGTQGVEAAFGLNATAEQQVIHRQQQRQAEFQGGGAAYADNSGVSGAGAAHPF